MHPDPDRLSQVALFAGLTPDERERLSAWLDVDEFSAGKLLAREGAHDYAFFILDAGSARVERDGATVHKLGPGDVFGEVAFFRDGRRTASVIAETDVRVLTMFGSRFREMQKDLPGVAARIERLARDRSPSGAD